MKHEEFADGRQFHCFFVRSAANSIVKTERKGGYVHSDDELKIIFSALGEEERGELEPEGFVRLVKKARLQIQEEGLG